jgi:hypothetical protein
MGGGDNNRNSSGDNWQQPRITPAPKEEEATQKTRSDANVPTEGISGPGGPVQNNEQKPNDFKPEQPGKKDPCLVKPFDTLLVYPVMSALDSTTVGSLLHLVSRGDRIEALNSSNENCGFITTRMHSLFKCLADNHRFLAKIIAIDGGSVKVHVYNELDVA